MSRLKNSTSEDSIQYMCILSIFFSHSLNLVIEIDGNYHESESQKILDADRSKMLEFQGLKVIRFSNREVVEKTEEVLKRIKSIIGLL